LDEAAGSHYPYCFSGQCRRDDLGIGSNKAQRASLAQPARNLFRHESKKRILVARSSRHGIPPPPTDLQASIKEEDTVYGTAEWYSG
jgi:hypothetical protein